MTTARDRVFATLRAGYRGRDEAAAKAAVAARLQAPRANLVPERARPAHRQGAIKLFIAMAEEASATTARVGNFGAVPWAVLDYLRKHNLPMRAVMAPDPTLDAAPWGEKPLLELRRDRAQAFDEVGIGTCFRAIAETGTLLARSGEHNPTTINFLPETHIAVIKASQIVGSFEEAVAALRQESAAMPRTVNFITGPSRSADIEQTLQLGAHGPRRLHIVIVDDAI
jgi:L-lactate dehydrogenase complex protein LldG